MVQILNVSGLSALATLGFVQRSGQRGTVDQGKSVAGAQRPMVDARPINAGFATVAAAVFGVSRTGVPPFANAAPNNFNLLAIGGVNSTIDALTADTRAQEAADTAAAVEATRVAAFEGDQNGKAPTTVATNSGENLELNKGPEPSSTPSTPDSNQGIQPREIDSVPEDKRTAPSLSQASADVPRGTFTDLLI